MCSLSSSLRRTTSPSRASTEGPARRPAESHNGELVHAVEAGALARADVTELGAVLDGSAEGRRGDEEITVFDSTGLAIQDLAVALEVLRRYDAEPDGFGELDTVDAG